jgi:hypothetical protein
MSTLPACLKVSHVKLPASWDMLYQPRPVDTYNSCECSKRRAVLTLLNDPEWAAWSDREIARQCAVTQPFVSSIRPKPASDNGYQMAEPRLVTANIRSERTYPMNTGNIGRGCWRLTCQPCRPPGKLTRETPGLLVDTISTQDWPGCWKFSMLNSPSRG